MTKINCGELLHIYLRKVKRIVALSLVFLLTIGYFSKMLVLVDYHLNKSAFIEKYCVNKSNPESGCQGTCHLNKKLSKQENQSDNTAWPYQLTRFELSEFNAENALRLSFKPCNPDEFKVEFDNETGCPGFQIPPNKPPCF